MLILCRLHSETFANFLQNQNDAYLNQICYFYLIPIQIARNYL
jgi:hypothetical protein